MKITKITDIGKSQVIGTVEDWEFSLNQLVNAPEFTRKKTGFVETCFHNGTIEIAARIGTDAIKIEVSKWDLVDMLAVLPQN